MKKLFILLLSTAMVIAANAADFTASVPGSWSDAATWGGSGVPAAGDNVFTNGIAVTVSADATCDNLTYTAVAGQLVLSEGVKLTVRGQINCPTLIGNNINVFAGSHDNSTVELTAALSPFPSGNVLITPNATNGMSANNIIINTTPGTSPSTTQYSFDANNNSPATGVRTGTFTVKAGSNFKMTAREFSVGTLSSNGLIIEEGAKFTASFTTRGTANGNAATVITVNGTLESSSHVNAKTLNIGPNGILRSAKSDRTSVTTPSSYTSDGWWGYLTSSVTPPATIFDKYVTPTALNFDAASTIEFNKAGAQNIPGIVATSAIGNTGAPYPIPYANIKLLGSGTKTVQSTLTAAGNMTVNKGVTLATATGVTATVNGSVLNLGTITGTVSSPLIINASSTDLLMGTITGSFTAADQVTLVATGIGGAYLREWKEGDAILSTEATLVLSTTSPSTAPKKVKGQTNATRDIVAIFDFYTGVSAPTKATTFVTVEGNTLKLQGNVTAVEVFDVQGRRMVSERNVKSVNVKGNGIYIVKMHTPQGVNVQKINIM